MIYLWQTSRNYPEKLMGIYEYDTERSPDWVIFRQGKRIDPIQKTPFIKFKRKMSEVQKYDCLTLISGSYPLINEKVRGIFEWICPHDVQFFKTIVECKDGVLENYHIVNITHTTPAADLEQSKYDFILNTKAILGFNFLVFNQNCLSRTGCEIALDEAYHSHVIVSEKIVTAFKGHRIKGAEFVTDEEYNYRLAQIYGRG